jgi:acetylornithine deacetylase/succinyl-diaminopimelate desuccinylase-like protein
MTSTSAIYSYIDSNLQAHLDRIVAFIQQPSVSLEGQSLAEGAQFMVESLRHLGCADATVVDVGDEYPGVFGSLDFDRPKTLLIYSHYDVRPVGQEPWTHDPFSGTVAEFSGFPKVVMGRGAAAKGPLQGFLNAVESVLAVEGSLPVNLIFLIEGAEILGSPNYGKLVERYGDAVRRASAIYGPRASQDGAGGVAVTLGYKGLIYLELTASGSVWGRGPQGTPIHSATNAIVDNPAWRLIKAVSTMTDDTGTRITIPELIDAVASPKPIQLWEQPFVEALVERAKSSNPNEFIPGLSPGAPVKTFRDNVSGEELVHRYLYGPSMNISGLRAGYTGPGTKSFLLPDRATVTLDLRLVTDTRAGDIVAILRRHLDQGGFPDMVIDVRCAYDWNQTSVESDLVRAAFGLLERAGLPRTVWPMQAFGGPWAHFAKVFGIPSLMGAAPGHGARVPTSDEFFVIEGRGPIAGLAAVEKHFVDFLFAYANTPAK